MTLKEKFENILCNWIDKDYNREFVAKQIEIDADDYAIEFAEWVIDYSFKGMYSNNLNELLKEFKKEKGL
jgi:hypothetical protein